MTKLGGKVEITRFKGLGEISPDEFGGFIGEDIRLQPVLLHDTNLHQIMEFYMGKNTPDRQEFIIDNLRVELDKVDKGAEGKLALEEQPEDAVA
jgi:topoisomerase-4 subunit B